MKGASSPGPDGIPVVLLKACAQQLSKPIKLLWEEAMSSGVVPSCYKN